MRLSRRLALGASMLVLALSACSTGGGGPSHLAPAVPRAAPPSRSVPTASTKPASSPRSTPRPSRPRASRSTGRGSGWRIERRSPTAALESGQIDLKPEYIGSGLVAGYGGEAPSQSSDTNKAALQEKLTAVGGGITVLAYTPGQDTNAFVVRKETADEFELVKLSDVTDVQNELKWALATDCPTNRAVREGAQGLRTASSPPTSRYLDPCSRPDGRRAPQQDSRRRRALLDRPGDHHQRLGRPRGRQADAAGRQHRADRP